MKSFGLGQSVDDGGTTASIISDMSGAGYSPQSLDNTLYLTSTSPSFGSFLNSIDATLGGGSAGYTGSANNSSSPSATTAGLLSALNSGIAAAAKTLGTRYAVPQLNAGQYISTGPYGTTTYQLAAGQTSMSSLTSSSSSMLLLLGGGALLLVMMMMKGKSN